MDNIMDYSLVNHQFYNGLLNDRCKPDIPTKHNTSVGCQGRTDMMVEAIIIFYLFINFDD
jgi:hypothetical protein